MQIVIRSEFTSWLSQIKRHALGTAHSGTSPSILRSPKHFMCHNMALYHGIFPFKSNSIENAIIYFFVGFGIDPYTSIGSILQTTQKKIKNKNIRLLKTVPSCIRNIGGAFFPV